MPRHASKITLALRPSWRASSTRYFTRVIRGEAAVARRMPILCRDHELEAILQFIDKRNDFVAARHGQRAAGQKIVLNIDNDQRLHVGSRCASAINFNLKSWSDFS